MGLLSRYLVAGDPFDDRWYTGGSVVIMGDASLLDPDSALRISTVWRAVNVLAGAVAMLPVDVFRRIDPARPEKGKEVAATDPMRKRLRLKPNRMQTSFRWRHHMLGHLLLGGNYYMQKVGWPGPTQQLWPLECSRVRPINVERDGSITYQYTGKSGEPEILPQDALIHYRGFTKDGIVGVSVLDIMRENTQLALASKRQRSAFVKNEMRPSVVVTHPGELGDAGKTNIAAGYQRAYSGRGQGGVLVLDEGMGIEPFQVNAKDGQYVEGEAFQVEEFLRFLGVPGVLVGHPDKTATYASAEQFFLSFVTHGVMPWTENIEQETTAALYGDDDDETFVEFNIDALLRADATARAAFYRAMIELGVYTRNEVRAIENRDPLKGLDDPLTPKNMGTEAEAPAPGRAPQRRPPADEPEEEDESRAHARAFRAALVRVVRKEALAIAGGAGRKGLAERYASDGAGWRRAVREFFDGHAEMVSEALALPAVAAKRYCDKRRDEVLARGLAALEEDGRVRLERMALEAE